MRALLSVRRSRNQPYSVTEQDLEIYWDAEFANSLETWGIGNVWHEVKFLALGWRGRVLDVGCGTGKTMEVLAEFPHLDVFGIDISDFLVKKAMERGILPHKIGVGDATSLKYGDREFDHAYSIGSLEHFTEDGIEKCISECQRITKRSAFHMVPVSRSGRDEGWLKTPHQSYYNNSVDWWRRKMALSYSQIIVLDSLWQGEHAVGKWLVGVQD